MATFFLSLIAEPMQSLNRVYTVIPLILLLVSVFCTVHVCVCVCGGRCICVGRHSYAGTHICVCRHKSTCGEALSSTNKAKHER